MTGKRRAIIFDFDGVVADTWALHRQAWQQVLGNKAGLDEALLAKTAGLSSLASAAMLVEELGELGPEVVAVELAERKDQQFEKLIGKGQLALPGTTASVKRLAADFPVAVVSLRDRKTTAVMLAVIGLGEVAYVCLDDVAGVPADAEPLLGEAAKRLGVPARSCLVVEDARPGVIAAKRAGMRVVAFDSHVGHEVDSSAADGQVGSLDELVPELVNQIFAA